jgi:iron complex outermembrane receptor protein
LGAQPLVLRNQADFYNRSTDFDESTEIDRNQQFLTVESELDGYTFFSITNRNDWSMNPNRVDLDLTNNTVPAQESVIIQDQIEWSQEFRLESERGSEIEWVLGAFYSDSEIDGDATRSFGLTEQTVYNLESRNIAIFASVAKDLTDNDNLSIGLRYDNFEKSIDRSKDGFNFVFVPGPPPNIIPTPYPTDNFSDSNDFDSFSPTLNWERKITEGLIGNLRATYSEKPGGFSAYTLTDSQITFLEEETLSYEIGLLFSPTESWGLNLTAYLNDIENYQFELPDLNPLSTDYYVDNADEVTAKGIEVEGYVKPSENFTFSVAYGLCDSEYDKFDGSVLAGKQVSFIPEHTLALSLNYEFDNGLHGQIGTKTIGDTHYWNYLGDNPTDKIDSYTLLDANLGYDWKSWEFSLFGLNLTDEEYYTSLVNNLTGTPGIAGSPRVIGLSISKEF